MGPTNGPVKELADRITRGRDSNRAKARALYELNEDLYGFNIGYTIRYREM